MECNIVLFIGLMFYSSFFYLKIESFDLSLYYFLIQSVSSSIFLAFTVLRRNFFFYGSSVILILSLVIKSGLFPLSFWLFNSLNSFSFTFLCFLLRFQKIPLYIFLFNLTSFFLLLLLIMSMVFGSYYLYFSYSPIFMLVRSSIYSCFWLFILYIERSLNFFFFFLVYTSFLFFFFLIYSIKNFQVVMDFDLVFFSFTMLLGLPPARIFFFKSYYMDFIFSWMGRVPFFFIWPIAFFVMLGYVKFMYKRFFFPYFFFKRGVKNFTKVSFFSILLTIITFSLYQE